MVEVDFFVYHSINTGVSLTFSVVGQLAFTGRQDVLTECPYKKNVPLNGQTK